MRPPNIPLHSYRPQTILLGLRYAAYYIAGNHSLPLRQLTARLQELELVVVQGPLNVMTNAAGPISGKSWVIPAPVTGSGRIAEWQEPKTTVTALSHGT
jgi:hypothetical protein